MFFEGYSLPERRGATLKRPPIPENGWRPPQAFPNLSGASLIGFDTETKEFDWERGPGWARGKVHVVGFSVSAMTPRGDKGSWYFPIRHEVDRSWNLDPINCLGWLDSVLNTPVPKVATNALYDVGTLAEEGVRVGGTIYDVQFAEALIDEQGDTNLDHLGRKYLNRGKEVDVLADWCRQAYGGGKEQRGNIYRSPPQLAGPYAEEDALMPLDILPWQWTILQDQNLVDLMEMECAAIPMLVKMRQHGVRVDLDKAHQIYDELGAELVTLYANLSGLCGFIVAEGVHIPEVVARIFTAAGVPFPRTAAGAPSFTKPWLAAQTTPVAAIINTIREYEKLRGTFLRNYILEGHTNGRIHCQFHPLRSDDGGAKTGRYSSSDPNLQNIPARSKNGKRIREAFLPDVGHVCWEKDDHSQIEYRMLANYAVGPGAEALRQEYWTDPKTDYHDRTFANFCKVMGLDLEAMSTDEKKNRRRPIKNVNFGLIYGQTEPSLAAAAGMSKAEAGAFFPAYHTAAPYVRETMAMNSQEVQALGYITTVMNRRTRFDMWEPMFREKGSDRLPALRYEHALHTYGHAIRRAYDYRATNYRFQGSAADCLKKGMLECYKSGVFDVIGYPLLQVHDELDFSVIDESPQQNEAYEFMRHTLTHAADAYIRVPLRVDTGRGPNWATAD